MLAGTFRSTLVLPLCIWGIAAAGCSQERSGARNATASAAERKLPDRMVRVEGQEVQRSVQVVRTIAGQEEVTFSTEAPSTVSKILVDVGDRVLPGQVVTKLDEKKTPEGSRGKAKKES